MTYTIVDPASLAGRPGATPRRKPVRQAGERSTRISAFEVYQVELPPGAETVRHNHFDDGVEDLYFVVSGDGWVMVDDEQLPLRPGLFVAVTVESARHVRAGTGGLAFVALCGTPALSLSFNLAGPSPAPGG